MVVADTLVWIEFLRGSEAVFDRMARSLRSCQLLGIDCIFAELLQGARMDSERREIRAYWESVPKPADGSRWIEAGEYSGRIRLLDKGISLIDMVIVVTAVHEGAGLWTLDRKLDAAWKAVRR